MYVMAKEVYFFQDIILFFVILCARVCPFPILCEFVSFYEHFKHGESTYQGNINFQKGFRLFCFF